MQRRQPPVGTGIDFETEFPGLDQAGSKQQAGNKGGTASGFHGTAPVKDKGAPSLPKPDCAGRFAARKDCPDSLNRQKSLAGNDATAPGW